MRVNCALARADGGTYFVTKLKYSKMYKFHCAVLCKMAYVHHVNVLHCEQVKKNDRETMQYNLPVREKVTKDDSNRTEKRERVAVLRHTKGQQRNFTFCI